MKKKKLIVFGLAIGLICASVSPVLASNSGSAEKQFDDSDFVILGKKSLEVKKTDRGTLYWNCTPEELIQAIISESYAWDEEDNTYGVSLNLKASDFKKVKDNNIFRLTVGRITVDVYATSSSLTDSRVTKVVLVNKAHLTTSKATDKERRANNVLNVTLTDIFTQYDYESRVTILGKLYALIDQYNYDNANYSKAMSFATARFQLDVGTKKDVLTITPKSNK